MERSGHIVEILDLGDARIFEPYRVKKREDLGSHRREEHIGTLHRGHRRRSSLRPTFGIRGGRKQDGGGPRARHHSALRLLQRDRHAGANRIVYFGHGVGNAQELGDPVWCGGR